MNNPNPTPQKTSGKGGTSGTSAQPAPGVQSRTGGSATQTSAPQPGSTQGGTQPGQPPRRDGEDTSAVKEHAQKAADALERGKEGVSQAASDAMDRAGDFYTGVRNELERAYEEGYHQGRVLYSRSKQRAGSFVRENPLAVVALGFAGGMLLGALLPRTSTEDRYIGHYRDDIADRARDFGEQSLRQGRERAEEALHAATETVRETVHKVASTDSSAQNGGKPGTDRPGTGGAARGN